MALLAQEDSLELVHCAGKCAPCSVHRRSLIHHEGHDPMAVLQSARCTCATPLQGGILGASLLPCASYQSIQDSILRFGFRVDVFRDLLQESDPICDGVDPTVVSFFGHRFYIVVAASLRRSFAQQRRTTTVSAQTKHDSRTEASVGGPCECSCFKSPLQKFRSHLVPRLMPLCFGPSPTEVVFATRSSGCTRQSRLLWRPSCPFVSCRYNQPHRTSFVVVPDGLPMH